MPFLVLAVVAIAPALVTMTMACGGRVDGDPSTIATAPPTSTLTPTATSATDPDAPNPGVRKTGPLAPCPADSTPLPTPGVNAAEDAFCTKVCDRTHACIGCTTSTCYANCIWDGRKGDCGGAYKAWAQCTLDHEEVACGAVAACNPLYCDYVRCNSAPGISLPGCP